jgi:hypothetical protein
MRREGKVSGFKSLRSRELCLARMSRATGTRDFGPQQGRSYMEPLVSTDTDDFFKSFINHYLITVLSANDPH